MKKLIILLMFVSSAMYGQLDSIDLSIHDFGLPSREGEADFMRNEAYKINQSLLSVDSLNAFIDVTDSTATFTDVSFDSISTDAMYYTDTYWDDLKAPFSSTRRGATSKPDFDYDNVGLLFKQNDTTEIVYAVMQFEHKRAAGSDIEPHIHWLQQNSNDVVWMMQYKWFDNNDPVPAAWTQLTEDHDVFTYSSGTLLQITDFAAIDGSGITGVSSILLVKIWRDDNVDGGAGSGDVLGYEFDVHYQSDQPGSANEYSK